MVCLQASLAEKPVFFSTTTGSTVGSTVGSANGSGIGSGVGSGILSEISGLSLICTFIHSQIFF
jgi:hypothetical protein